MDLKTTRRIHRVAALVLFAAVAFFAFFQASKSPPFRAVNPFLNDPYDVVGSFAIQIALLVGILTYARALRLRHDSAQAGKARLILRGSVLVVGAILATLAADAIAEIAVPVAPSYWGKLLLAGLGLMFVLALACCAGLLLAFRQVPTALPPRDLTLADSIDDLWTLVRVPVVKSGAILPAALVAWVARFNSDRLFVHLQSLDPRRRSWRFACALGLLVGVLLFLGQLREGLPPSLAIGILVGAIFISAEFIATLLGFLLLGGYLGLRPSLTAAR